MIRVNTTYNDNPVEIAVKFSYDWQKANYCLCEIFVGPELSKDSDKPLVIRGQSFRNPKDAPNRLIGRTFAYTRAQDNLAKVLSPEVADAVYTAVKEKVKLIRVV